MIKSVPFRDQCCTTLRAPSAGGHSEAGQGHQRSQEIQGHTHFQGHVRGIHVCDYQHKRCGSKDERNNFKLMPLSSPHTYNISCASLCCFKTYVCKVHSLILLGRTAIKISIKQPKNWQPVYQMVKNTFYRLKLTQNLGQITLTLASKMQFEARKRSANLKDIWQEITGSVLHIMVSISPTAPPIPIKFHLIDKWPVDIFDAWTKGTSTVSFL